MIVYNLALYGSTVLLLILFLGIITFLNHLSSP